LKAVAAVEVVPGSLRIDAQSLGGLVHGLLGGGDERAVPK
jgi:hypothetical protein